MKKRLHIIAIIFAIMFFCQCINSVFAQTIDVSNLKTNSRYMQSNGWINNWQMNGKFDYQNPANYSGLPFPYSDTKWNTGHAITIHLVEDLNHKYYENGNVVTSRPGVAYIGYCIGYGDAYETGHPTISKTPNNITSQNYGYLTEEQQKYFLYTLLFGFNAKELNESADERTSMAMWYCAYHDYSWPTQVLLWEISTGHLNNNAHRTAIENYLIEPYSNTDANIGKTYSWLRNMVMRAVRMPSFTDSNEENAEVLKMDYDAENGYYYIDRVDDYDLYGIGEDIEKEMQRRESTLSNRPTSPGGMYMHDRGVNPRDLVDLPSFNLSYDSDSAEINVKYYEKDGKRHTVLYSTEPIGTKDNPVTITAKKEINGNVGGVWYVQGEGEAYQPLAIYNPYETRDSEKAYIKVYTDSLKLRVNKSISSTSGNKGSATVGGAVFGIFEDEKCIRKITQIVTNNEGVAESDILPVTTAYIKEIAPAKGTQINNTVYKATLENSVLQDDGTRLFTITIENKVLESHLKITKMLGETDYDPKMLLSEVQFELKLINDEAQRYVSNVSTINGICEIKNIPFGEYICKEIKLNDMGYKANDFIINFNEDGKTYTYEIEDPPKMMQIAVNKKLLDETIGKTDAKVAGAYFTVYTDAAATIPFVDKNGRTVVIGPTNSIGYAISEKMRTGTYYLKETVFPEGINPKAFVPGENVTYENKIYEASYDNRKQGTDVVIVNFEKLVNIPNFGRVRVIKYKDVNDKSEEIPAVGAKLRLTLVSSNGSVYYDGTVNETGYCEFIKEDVKYISPTYTIPYGEYEITELDEGGNLHKYYFIQPEIVQIVNNEDDQKRIVADNPVPAWLKIIKKDRLTNLTVKLEGAEYAIWDLQENKFVEQMSYEDGGVISRFKTNKDGYLVTPEKVQPGEYVIYETNAPEGYFLQEEWRLPEKSEEYGKVGGKKIKVDKITTGVAEDTTYPEGGVVTGEIVLDTTIDDVPLTVNLELYKTGEKFTGAKTEKVTYPVSETENRDEDLYTPVYTELPLQGVGYRIYAVADTYTPDGIKRYSKDQMVADITTDENGYAVAKKLFPGEYRIEEYKTPKGYLKDENIPNVVLENKDQYLETATVKKELTDERQKLGLTFKKEYEEVKYSDEEELVQKSLFGVYTKQTLNNYQGTATISRNSLVELIWADDENDVTSKADLPEGTYYVKELYVTYPYNIDTNTYDYNLAHSNNATEKVVIVRGKNIINTPTTTTLTLVKIATTSVDELIVSGNVIDTTGLEDKVQKVLNEMNGMTREEIKEYFKENNVRTVPGAEYGIYVDEDCTKALKIKNNDTGKYENVTLVSDELGLIELEDIPIRTYYLKELRAPNMYKKSDKVIKVQLDNVNKDGMVYNAMIEEEVVPHLITKTDIFTGDVVPNCVFEIRDKEGTLILKSITNENGEASIPISIFEKGEKYTYTEIEAPSIYELNKEPHEFVADYNDKYEWIEKIKVENTRKSKELRVLKVDDETGEPLKGCIFSIVLLDENGEPKTREDGSVVYLVENGVTDENGEYLIEKAYYGTYKFTEIEAPEGYEMNEESMEGYVFTIDEDSPDRIDFIVTNTGDIAVIMISILSVSCIIGIVIGVKKIKNSNI